MWKNIHEKHLCLYLSIYVILLINLVNMYFTGCQRDNLLRVDAHKKKVFFSGRTTKVQMSPLDLSGSNFTIFFNLDMV